MRNGALEIGPYALSSPVELIQEPIHLLRSAAGLFGLSTLLFQYQLGVHPLDIAAFDDKPWRTRDL